MMDVKGNSNSNSSSSTTQSDEEMVGDLRKGPWTVEEDFKLINYIAAHGEGRWNSLARCAGKLLFLTVSNPFSNQNIYKPNIRRRGKEQFVQHVLICFCHVSIFMIFNGPSVFMLFFLKKKGPKVLNFPFNLYLLLIVRTL